MKNLKLILLVLLILSPINLKAEPGFYVGLGLMVSDGQNIICLRDSFNVVGDVEVGYRLEGPETVAFFYRHNSCLDQDGKDENGLNVIGFRKEFKL